MAGEKVETPVSTVLKQAVQHRLQAKQNICAFFSLSLLLFNHLCAGGWDAWIDAVFPSGMRGVCDKIPPALLGPPHSADFHTLPEHQDEGLDPSCSLQSRAAPFKKTAEVFFLGWESSVRASAAVWTGVGTASLFCASSWAISQAVFPGQAGQCRWWISVGWGSAGGGSVP